MLVGKMLVDATLALEPKSSGTSANTSLVVQRSPPSNGQLLVATVFAVINWESRQILAFRLQIGAPVDVVAGAEVVVPEVVDNEEVLEVTVADVVDKLEDDVEAPMGPTDEDAETELVDEDVEAAVEPSEEVKLEVDVEAPMGPTDEDAETELVDEDVEDAVEPSDEVDTKFVVEKVDVEAPMGSPVEADDELVKKLDGDVELLIGLTDDEADAEVVGEDESEVEEVLPLIGPTELLAVEVDTAMLDAEVEVLL
ncbi:hypothetical protein LTR96_008188 [Exophiala xenobiotica]|uniref:Uncharacterized protein n=1 Tax=Vermiconidia calcicola TaxID=1690605 RepID=A0AAV9PT55_9PEZI|nr:hypothetical protein LTR96_008188 [Exophiala xenobiotica]KAK5335404.1 hypothetical protein LTR98_008404 [Exophiala xenobiotica]KAK5529124.1 hypothetical protein LTR25_009861 [Vermiconidia calcicola]